ncbi:hypothetical protein SGFS_024440 [Streptomyces graminofaciens]|uniref:Extracellular solute-binding protein n=1 Tax=Streptomyces graminofaciens TaxID=68212 RepID=A0ABM7F5M9_9ACTN|nr:hypothetical protein SGFS_024440 [Streptomyces graminofaciens]
MSVGPGNGNPATTYVLAKPGYLRDLSDQPWAAELPDAMKSVAQYEGKTYSAVFGQNGIGAVYKEQAVKKAGLTPPDTWTELLAFCKAAKVKGTPAFAVGNQDNWVTQLVLYALVATTVYGDDRDFDQKMQAGRATFAKSRWTTALDKYLTMEKTGCFQKNPLGTTYEAGQQLAATGKTLGIVQGNWVIALQAEESRGHVHAQGAARRRRRLPDPHTRRGGRRIRRQREGEERETGAEVRELRDVARGHERVREEAGRSARPARHGLHGGPVTRRTLRVHRVRPHSAVHGSALAQPQGPADHAQRPPGDLQRAVHAPEAPGRNGRRLQVRLLTPHM